MTKKFAIYMMSCSLLLACNGYEETNPVEPSKPPSEKTKELFKSAFDLQTELLNHRAPLAIGIDVIKGKSILVNTVTGEEVKPCENSTIFSVNEAIDTESKKDYQNPAKTPPQSKYPKEPDCKVSVNKPSQKLKSVLEATQKIIDGTVIRNGKEIPARFSVQVTALYKGSNCITVFIDGDQSQELCVVEETNCADSFNRNMRSGRFNCCFPKNTCTLECVGNGNCANCPENEIKEDVIVFMRDNDPPACVIE